MRAAPMRSLALPGAAPLARRPGRAAVAGAPLPHVGASLLRRRRATAAAAAGPLGSDDLEEEEEEADDAALAELEVLDDDEGDLLSDDDDDDEYGVDDDDDGDGDAIDDLDPLLLLDAAASPAAKARRAADAPPPAAGADDPAPPPPAFPEPPRRVRDLAGLLAAAGFADAAAAAPPGVAIGDVVTCNTSPPSGRALGRSGVASFAGGGPGAACFDAPPAPPLLYVCVPADDCGADGHDYAAAAVAAGAVAVVASRPVPDAEALLPPGCVVYVGDAPRALGALAAEFFDHPSRRMTTFGFVGSFGKTTAAWLTRGALEFEDAGDGDAGGGDEEAGGLPPPRGARAELVGMVGTVEYALREALLGDEGELWAPDEPDPSAGRAASVPFGVIPYAGRYGARATTPDALRLQRVLAGCADRGATAALVECCPSAAADGRLDAVDFDVLVFTNIFPERVEEAGGDDSYEAYVERIGAMFDRLSDGERQAAVINVDDPHGAALAARAAAAGAAVVTYGLDAPDADVGLEKLRPGLFETELLVRTPLSRLQIIVPLLGRQNASNVLAAVAACIAAGRPLRWIVAGVESVDVVPGRCHVHEGGAERGPRSQFSVVVDAAATPGQLGRLIDDVKDAGARRTTVVFGCPGDTSAEHRAAMGRVAHLKADAVFLTNDSPGGCFPDAVVADVAAGFPEEVRARHADASLPWLQDPHRLPHWSRKAAVQLQSRAARFVVEDRATAIRVALGMARPNEVVLLTGRGHRDWQDYWDGVSDPDDPHNPPGTVRAWFDDAAEVAQALAMLPQLDGLKDLDRSALPWTRYPEERELLGTEALLDAVEAAAAGGYYQR